MNNFTKEHPDRITAQNAKDWLGYTDSIIPFAQANGISLGVNAFGDWVVLDNGVHLFRQDVEEAVAKYHELVKERI